MKVLNPYQQRQPLGGHHFPEENGPIIQGGSFREVVDKVREFRVINGRIAGDPERDVIGYYARRFPYMVQEGEDQPEARSPALERYAHWIRTVWKNPPNKFVIKQEAERRWNICKTCPCNIVVDWGSGEEIDELRRREFILARGLPTPRDVGFCALHRFPCGVVSYLESPAGFSGKPKDNKEEPGCWV